MKPDPPLNVTVEAVERSPQRLCVRWSYPPSWDPRFYWLRFQVRYRPEPAPNFTQVSPLCHGGVMGGEEEGVYVRLPHVCVFPPPQKVDQVTRTWLDIRDAWRGMRHVVQVRAQEEFGHGAWSEWSREAVGTPWTGNSGRVGMCPPPSCGAVWGSVCHTAPPPPPPFLPHLAEPRDVTEMGLYSSQVGGGVTVCLCGAAP